MSHRILDVGNCSHDHSQIRHCISKHFDAHIQRADTAEAALALLADGTWDLVLINRKLAMTNSDGLELINKIKSDDALSSVPVMLVSNYAEAQAQAIAAGAEPGFGKSELADDQTRQKLAAILS